MLRVEDYSQDELQRKREEAERKARRGEIDPTQEFTFTLISKVRHFISTFYYQYLILVSDNWFG